MNVMNNLRTNADTNYAKYASRKVEKNSYAVEKIIGHIKPTCEDILYCSVVWLRIQDDTVERTKHILHHLWGAYYQGLRKKGTGIQGEEEDQIGEEARLKRKR